MYERFSSRRGPAAPAYGGWQDGACDEASLDEGAVGTTDWKAVLPSLCGTGCLAALSIPAMIGAWCWPAVLAASLGPAFNSLDSVGSKQLAHTLMFAFNLATFSSMLTFVAVKTSGKRGHLPRWQAWAPFAGLFLAAALIMFDLTRHVLLDAGMFISSLHMFNRDSSLTPAGLFGMWATWIGNALLIVSLIAYVLPAPAAGGKGDERRDQKAVVRQGDSSTE